MPDRCRVELRLQAEAAGSLVLWLSLMMFCQICILGQSGQLRTFKDLLFTPQMQKELIKANLKLPYAEKNWIDLTVLPKKF